MNLPKLCKKLIITLGIVCLGSTVAYSEQLQSISGKGMLFGDSRKAYQINYENFFNELNRSLDDVEIHVSFDLIRRAVRSVALGESDFFYPVFCEEYPTGEIRSGLTRGSESLGYIPVGIFSHPSKPVTVEAIKKAKYRISKKSLRILKNEFSQEDFAAIKTVKGSFEYRADFLNAIGLVLKRKLKSDEKNKLAMAGFPYTIEATHAYAPYIGAPVQKSDSIDTSVRKLLRKRIDAYINVPIQVEKVLEKKGRSKDIFRALHKIHEGCYIVQANEHGNEVNLVLQRAFKTVKVNGAYDQIFGDSDREEKAWVERYQ